MSALFPDTATVQAALSLADRAPSMHESPPWRWRVDDNRLHLYVDPDVRFHADPDGRDRIVSSGASLHHCVIALAALGWRARVRRLPDPTDPGHLAALELCPEPATADNVALADAAGRRTTDRGPYRDRPVPATTIAAITSRLTPWGVTVREVHSVSRVGSIVAGVHAPSGGTTGLVDELNGAEDHAVLLALGTANDRSLARLHSGEASSLILLRATVAGLSACAVTRALELAETREIVQREVFNDRASPQVLIRIGWPCGA